jgi:hypothetical protein
MPGMPSLDHFTAVQAGMLNAYSIPFCDIVEDERRLNKDRVALCGHSHPPVLDSYEYNHLNV